MFVEIRYQTGEINKIMQDMKNGIIPKMDVDNHDELKWFLEELKKHNIFTVEDEPFDRKARDTVKEPEFEFRIPFYSSPVKKGDVPKENYMYIDVYFEPIPDEDYAPAGEM